LFFFVFVQVSFASKKFILWNITPQVLTRHDIHMEPETSISNWLIRLDDCKSLHRRWLFDETSMKKKLLEVPGMCDDLRWLVLFLQSYQPMRITCHIGFHLPINYDNHLADPSLYLKDWDSHVVFFQ